MVSSWHWKHKKKAKRENCFFIMFSMNLEENNTDQIVLNKLNITEMGCKNHTWHHSLLWLVSKLNSWELRWTTAQLWSLDWADLQWAFQWLWWIRWPLHRGPTRPGPATPACSVSWDGTGGWGAGWGWGWGETGTCLYGGCDCPRPAQPGCRGVSYPGWVRDLGWAGGRARRTCPKRWIPPLEGRQWEANREEMVKSMNIKSDFRMSVGWSVDLLLVIF